MFRFQLRDKIKGCDLLIGISGSGNSPNVVNAVEYAKGVGCSVVGITGHDGGGLRGLADYDMHVDVDDMQLAEDDVRMSFEHMMYRVLRSEKAG